MTSKTKPEIHVVTDCSGNKEHEVTIDFPPTLDAAGYVSIGDEPYRVAFREGNRDDMTFTKRDGTTYKVVCWTADPGNFDCTCDDFIYRSQRRQYQCKHLGVAFILKGLLPVVEVAEEEESEF